MESFGRYKNGRDLESDFFPLKYRANQLFGHLCTSEQLLRGIVQVYMKVVTGSSKRKLDIRWGPTVSWNVSLYHLPSESKESGWRNIRGKQPVNRKISSQAIFGHLGNLLAIAQRVMRQALLPQFGPFGFASRSNVAWISIRALSPIRLKSSPKRICCR